MTQQKSDPPLVEPGDLVAALSLLSRLPLPATDGTRTAAAAWAYPLAGALLGALAALVGALATGVGLPPLAVSLLVLATLVMLTGAMHEDGLADTADGLWGGWDRAARLEIMRDSRIGTYGVIALVLSLAARGAALWLLYDTSLGAATLALIASAALSRACMPVLMATQPHARHDGLSHRVGQVPMPTAALGAALALCVAVICLGTALIAPLLWAALVCWGIALIARRKIGGQTGDILGAAQQLSEIAILFALIS